MHHIQYKILIQLMSAPVRRFSELRPEGVESNLFQYHLRHTIKEGYVEKVEGGYILSPKGLYFADRHSASLRDVREQPKIITIIVIRDAAGRTLLQSKRRQPFVGSYHLPAGKIHEKESIDAAARRELFEKTGINDVELTYAASAHGRIYKAGELVSDYIGFVFCGQLQEDKPEDVVWYREGDSLELAPSVCELISLANNPEPGPKEITIDL